MTNQSTLPTVKKFALPTMLLAAVLALPVMSASASTDKGTEKVTDTSMENIQYEIDMKELGINPDEEFTFELGGTDENMDSDVNMGDIQFEIDMEALGINPDEEFTFELEEIKAEK